MEVKYVIYKIEGHFTCPKSSVSFPPSPSYLIVMPLHILRTKTFSILIYVFFIFICFCFRFYRVPCHNYFPTLHFRLVHIMKCHQVWHAQHIEILFFLLIKLSLFFWMIVWNIMSERKVFNINGQDEMQMLFLAMNNSRKIN